VTLSVLTFIPDRLTDGASSGGGSPKAKISPLPAAAPAPAAAPPVLLVPPNPVPPAPAPPKSQPPAVKPEQPAESEPPPKPRRHTGEPVPSETKSETKVEELSSVSEAKPAKHKVEVSLTRETSPSKESREAAKQAAAAQARAAQARYASGVNNVLNTLAQGVSSGTHVDVPGPGGEAYGNYKQAVISIYHRAWSPPSDLADSLATVTVQVVILRNGKVESFKVLKRTGHSALDRSVERLVNVRSIAPFPEGAPDDRRLFIIDFNLRSRNS